MLDIQPALNVAHSSRSSGPSLKLAHRVSRARRAFLRPVNVAIQAAKLEAMQKKLDALKARRNAA